MDDGTHACHRIASVVVGEDCELRVIHSDAAVAFCGRRKSVHCSPMVAMLCRAKRRLTV